MWPKGLSVCGRIFRDFIRGIFTFLIAELNAAAIMTIEMAHDRFRGLLGWNVLEQCTMCSIRM
ncbi:transmembrane protein, putative [Medicago truncatula]|uniref:Transmembrane protein, putative n=1 Tax=Medicago truncatula TaxID=3880 RepID=A0A072UFM9_MEDTR|nr:transmembrane protein, putative [Medicago truncatula]